MRTGTFKFCMLFAGITLLGVATFYFVSYIGVKIAIANSGLKPFYQDTIRALWMTFGFQAALIGVLYSIVAYRPHSVTREVIVIFGLLQLVEAVLLVTFAGSWLAAALLGVAALCVMIAALIWPAKLEPEIAYSGTATTPELTPAPTGTTPTA